MKRTWPKVRSPCLKSFKARWPAKVATTRQQNVRSFDLTSHKGESSRSLRVLLRVNPRIRVDEHNHRPKVETGCEV